MSVIIANLFIGDIYRHARCQVLALQAVFYISGSLCPRVEKLLCIYVFCLIIAILGRQTVLMPTTFDISPQW